MVVTLTIQVMESYSGLTFVSGCLSTPEFLKRGGWVTFCGALSDRGQVSGPMQDGSIDHAGEEAKSEKLGRNANSQMTQYQFSKTTVKQRK